MSIPVLVAKSAEILGAVATSFILLFALENLVDPATAVSLLKGDLVPDERILACAFLLLKMLLAAFVVVSAFESSLRASLLYPYAADLLLGVERDLSEYWADLPRNLRRALAVALVVELAGLAAPLFALLHYSEELLRVLMAEELRSPLEILAWGAVVLLALVAMLASRFFFVFAYQAAVVDDLGPMRAIARSATLAVRNLASVVGLAALYLAGALSVALAAAALRLVNVEISDVAGLAVVAVAIPILDTTLLGVYLQSTGRHIADAVPPGAGLLQRALEGLWGGLSELSRYLSRENACYVALSSTFLALGFGLGTVLSEGPLGNVVGALLRPGEVSPVFERVIPVSLLLNIFAHNWMVSILTSFSGVFTMFVPALNCMLNGLVLGLAFTSLGPLEFARAVIPHGILELPCFILAASTGIKLGYFVMTKRELSHEVLREAARVLVGLAPLFLIAAAVETLVTPLVMKGFAGI